MGCWNGTCGISNLPIRYGEEVRGVLIEGVPYKLGNHALRKDWTQKQEDADYWREGWWSGYVYSTDIFVPRTFPFKGTYDDYGSIDLTENGLIEKIIVEQFEKDLIEHPAGRFNIPEEVVKTMSLQDMMDAVERNCVSVEGYRGEAAPIGIWMVREDIYQAVIASKLEDTWTGRGLSIKRFLAEKAKFLGAVDTRVKLLTGPEDIRSIIRESLGSLPLDNSVLSVAFGGILERDKAGFFMSSFVNRVASGEIKIDSPETEDFFRRVCEFGMFRLAMSDARIGWMPQAGAGSQNSGTSVHAAIAKAIIKVHKKRLKEYAEETE